MYSIDLTLEQLQDAEKRGRIVRRDHPWLPLHVWNYSPEIQYDRSWDEVTLRTRGLVTDRLGHVIGDCIPKFFNLGETDHKISDFDVAYQKLDGSLITLCFYGGVWVVSSRGSFESDQAGWAREIVREPGFEEQLDPNFTYVCELIHPENRIVVDYSVDERSYGLWLLTRFHNGIEVPNDPYTEFPGGRVIRPSSVDVAIDYMEGEYANNEGFVLMRLEDNKRIKVKHEEYVRLHRIMTQFSVKRVLEAWGSGMLDDMIDKVPDEVYDAIHSIVDDAEAYVNLRREEILDKWEEVKHLVEIGRKELAMKVKSDPDSGYLFTLADGRSIDRRLQDEVIKQGSDVLDSVYNNQSFW